MKALKIIALLLCLHSAAYTQEKIEKYVEIRCYHKAFTDNKASIVVSVGSVDSLFSFKDSTIITSLNKVKDLKTRIDVLNYMGKLHWALVTTTQLVNDDEYTFIFKRVFDKSELLVQ